MVGVGKEREEETDLDGKLLQLSNYEMIWTKGKVGMHRHHL